MNAGKEQGALGPQYQPVPSTYWRSTAEAAAGNYSITGCLTIFALQPWFGAGLEQVWARLPSSGHDDADRAAHRGALFERMGLGALLLRPGKRPMLGQEISAACLGRRAGGLLGRVREAALLPDKWPVPASCPVTQTGCRRRPCSFTASTPSCAGSPGTSPVRKALS